MVFKVMKKSRRSSRREEATFQTKLVNLLRVILPKDAFVFAVPNGGKRDVVEAVNLKRQGVVAGVPDLCIIHKGRAFGLELKAKAGKLSDSQAETFPKLRDAGMRIEVARSEGEAIGHIKDMGIPLKTGNAPLTDRDVTREIQQVFKEETRRRG